MKIDRPIIFFDSECLLCNRLVLFVLTHKRREFIFFFTPIKGVTAKPLQLDKELMTLIYPDGEKFKGFEAALHVASWMKFPYGFLSKVGFWFYKKFPKRCDEFYQLVARNRKMFKLKSCSLQESKEAARFILP